MRTMLLVLALGLSGCDLSWLSPMFSPTDGAVAVGNSTVMVLQNSGLFSWAPRSNLQGQTWRSDAVCGNPSRGIGVRGDGRLLWDPVSDHFLATELNDPLFGTPPLSYCMEVLDESGAMLASTPLFVPFNGIDHGDLGRDDNYLYLADAMNQQIVRWSAADAFQGTIAHQIVFQPPPSHGGQYHPATAEFESPFGHLVTFDYVHGVLWVVEMRDTGPDTAPTMTEHALPLPHYHYDGPKSACEQAGGPPVECFTGEIAQGGVIESGVFLDVAYTSTYLASDGHLTAYVGIVVIDEASWTVVDNVLVPSAGVDAFWPAIATDGQTVYLVANAIMLNGYIGAFAAQFNPLTNFFSEQVIAQASVPLTGPLYQANPPIVRFGDYNAAAPTPGGGAVGLVAIPWALPGFTQTSLVQPWIHTWP